MFFKRRTIPYAVLNKTAFLDMKMSYDIHVDLVDGRLPNEQELTVIAKHLRSKKHDLTFVCFYLHGMKIDAGAWAIGHHAPELRVEIFDYMVPDALVEKETL